MIDINDGILSGRYARALLEYASEKSAESSVYEEMKQVGSAFVTHPRLQEALLNPTVSGADKSDLLMDAAGGSPSPELHKFIELVISEKRESFFRNMALMYCRFYQERQGLEPGLLITATPVPDDLRSRIVSQLSRTVGKSIDFDYQVDPRLLGGFILQVGTLRLDASLRGSLNTLKHQFLNQ